jgi:hypothetical protein
MDKQIESLAPFLKTQTLPQTAEISQPSKGEAYQPDLTTSKTEQAGV